MTTIPLTPVPLTPAQQMALLGHVVTALKSAQHGILQRHPEIISDGTSYNGELERADLIKCFPYGAYVFVVPTLDGMQAAYRAYAEDMAAQGAEGCL